MARLCDADINLKQRIPAKDLQWITPTPPLPDFSYISPQHTSGLSSVGRLTSSEQAETAKQQPVTHTQRSRLEVLLVLGGGGVGI